MRKKSLRLDLLIWYRLSRFYNHSVRLSNQHLKQWELTVAQFDVLVQVGTEDRMTQQQLGEKLLVTKGNITKLLQKMEETSLIQREQEWKTKYISLTEKGKQLFAKVVPAQEQFQASQFDSLSVEEKKQLVNLLKKI
ncbi:MarR family winged helix-turn-helix transcriptional regulator [Paenibacillus yanchengensis]|uniref:MarR family winged helix-turn-helix transcriptional regulator n=1 Tax=Paenibacillus yanchengensis TaxID=2035833 RepID=A0ABW4YFV3_9BACL